MGPVSVGGEDTGTDLDGVSLVKVHAGEPVIAHPD